MAPRFQRNPDVEVAPLDEEVLLFHASANRFCILNATAARMWERLEQPATVAELAQDLEARFGAPRDAGSILTDVEQAIAVMRGMVLISEAAT